MESLTFERYHFFKLNLKSTRPAQKSEGRNFSGRKAERSLAKMREHGLLVPSKTCANDSGLFLRHCNCIYSFS